MMSRSTPPTVDGASGAALLDKLCIDEFHLLNFFFFKNGFWIGAIRNVVDRVLLTATPLLLRTLGRAAALTP